MKKKKTPLKLLKLCIWNVYPVFKSLFFFFIDYNSLNKKKCKKKFYVVGCNNSALMYNTLEYHPNQQLLTGAVQKMKNQSNSILFIGVGLHQKFDMSFVNNSVLQPILKAKGESKWPYLIYAGNHHFGILRNPTDETTKEATVAKFNRELKSLVSGHNVTFFDTFHMTRRVVSYDGTHYGQGVNQAKVKVLLNVIRQLKDSLVMTG